MNEFEAGNGGYVGEYRYGLMKGHFHQAKAAGRVTAPVASLIDLDLLDPLKDVHWSSNMEAFVRVLIQ